MKDGGFMKKNLTYYFTECTYVSPKMICDKDNDFGLDYSKYNMYIIVKHNNIDINFYEEEGRLAYALSEKYGIVTKNNFVNTDFFDKKNGTKSNGICDITQSDIIYSILGNSVKYNFMDFSLDFQVLYVGISDRKEGTIKDRLQSHSTFLRIISNEDAIDDCVGVFLLSSASEVIELNKSNVNIYKIENGRDFDVTHLKVLEELLIKKFKPKYNNLLNNNKELNLTKNGNKLESNEIDSIQLIGDFNLNICFNLVTDSYKFVLSNFFQSNFRYPSLVNVVDTRVLR